MVDRHKIPINNTNAPVIRHLGRQPYAQTFDAMRSFTQNRLSHTGDEIWLVEHEPVFTLGLAADKAHIFHAQDIPIIQSDRGGQVTYHAEGQAIAYLLFNLRAPHHEKHFLRTFVSLIEQAVINMLARHHIDCERKAGAPGIYIKNAKDLRWNGAKIAALGLKVTQHGFTYHGIALNVDMDLTPFSWINPCGDAHLSVVDLKSLHLDISLDDAQNELADELIKVLC